MKMPQGGPEWGRALIMFVIAWLVAVYVYDVVSADWNSTGGFALAAATFIINGIARWRATKNVDATNWRFYFWMTLPLVLFLLVPATVRLVTCLRDETTRSWWDYLWPLLPPILKLGVPVGALFVVFLILGHWGKGDGERTNGKCGTG